MVSPPPCQENDCSIQEALLTIINLSRMQMQLSRMKLEQAEHRIAELEKLLSFHRRESYDR
jgi:hypothetical protein